MRRGPSLPKVIAALLVVASVVIVVVAVVQARDRYMDDCAPHIRSTPVHEWRGGVPPERKRPAGCP